jgi:[ribosomal protein S18]-alanine N-acetyltransferase
MIRDFHAVDLKAVQKVLSNVPEAAPWSADDLLAPKTGLFLRIAENQGVVCGFLAFRITADEAEILNLAVDSAVRRRGLGSQLMKDAIKACKTAGAKKIFLEVRDSNQSAQKFYSQMGFAQVGRRREYYRRPAEDALILVHTVE